MKIRNWACDKENQKRNIRNLLTSMHVRLLFFILF
jgi:hypothetical protein